MPRPEDVAWKFVIRRGKKWHCPYCENEYSGSVPRVRSHFLKQRKEGIASCTKVPEHISTLMELLRNHQVRNKEDIAWEFVNRLGDGKWRCHYCSEEFLGDLTGVKGHLLGVPNEGISICTQVPDHVRKLMQSLVDEVGEEQSRDAHGQSSMEPQSRDMPTQAEVAEDESREANRRFFTEPESRDALPPAIPWSSQSFEDTENLFSTPGWATGMEGFTSDQDRQFQDTSVMPSQAQSGHVESISCLMMALTEEEQRGANGQSSTEPQSRQMPAQAEVVAEEESREAYCQYSAETQCRDMSTQAEVDEESREAYSQFSTEPLWPLLSPERFSLDFVEQTIQELMTADIRVNSDQQSQAEHQCRQSSTMPLFVQSSPVQPALVSPQHQSVLHQSVNHETRDTRQNATMPLDNLDTSQQPDLHDHLAENLVVPFDAIVNLPEVTQTNEVLNPTVGSSLQNELSLHVDRMNRSEDCSQPCVGEGVPVLSNTSTANAVQHPDQLPPRCDKEDGNDTRLFPLPTRMDIDPPIAPRNSSGGANSTDSTGPSSSQVQPALVPLQQQSVPHQFMSPQTRNVQQNPTGLSSPQKNHMGPCRTQAPMNTEPCIPSSSQAPNNALPPPQIQCCGTGLIGPSSLPELGMNMGAPLRSHTNTDNNFQKTGALKRKIERLYRREADIRDKLEFAASLSLKKQRTEVKNWLADMEKLRDEFQSIAATSKDCSLPHQQVDILMQEVEDLMEQGKFPKGLFVVRETKINKLLERKLVGEAFQRNTTEILEYLVGNQISQLGIYGMGGVGKTALMVHIHNRLLEKANHDNVLWITVSQDFNTQRLQDKIWEALSVGKLREKDVRKRAAMLSDVLTKREKLIIILDDVWERLDLEEVGIPIKSNGFKLVLTTRSFDVCRQMQCQEKIKIEPLSQNEAESLFWEELGSKVVLNLEIKAITESIVRECAGLPIGVITMARSMREVTNVFEWRDSLVELKESSMGQTDMENKVLMNLKFSYDCLGNPFVQQCFLSCALYPEDGLINKFELVEFFIDQGLIDELSTRKEQYDRGLAILNKLGNVCLLEDHGNKMKMHDLIRDMALHIMSATSIVKAGKMLTRIPPQECWTEALEKVSLMENEISGFPLNISPNCPRLSTLLLNSDRWSKDVVIIPDSFFRQFCGLKVLNLSECCLRELPDSISDLVNLRALLLSCCSELRRIPYLGKLTSLRKLDVSGCHSLDALEGLEKLMNLRYLNLTQTCIERLPKGILNRLLNLQLFEVSAVIEEEDITKLWALEAFECCLKNVDDFNKCVRFIEQSDNPRYYDLNCDLGKDYKKSEVVVKVSDDARIRDLGRSVCILGWGHAIVSVGREYSGIFILVPRDVQDLEMTECDGMTSLSGMGPLEHLEKLEIGNWENLGVLCGGKDEEVIDIRDSPAPTPTPLLFPSLRALRIFRCLKLKYLFGHGSISNLPHLREIQIKECEEMVGIIAAVTSPPPHPLPAFPSLEDIIIIKCGKMKRAVESEWMPHFPNLRRIEVERCEKMEEIIGGPPPHASVEKISLEYLGVYGCDNMRKLFSHELLLHLRNLQEIWVSECEGMVEMISGAGQGQEGSIMTPVNNTPPSFQPPSISLPNLKQLHLDDLPQLKSICRVPISCDSIKRLRVYDCPELKAIPLELRLRDIDIEELPYIGVEDEEKWKTLMWDDPNAQAILQPYLRKGENAKYNFYVSPNSIELDTEGNQRAPWRWRSSFHVMRH